MEALGTHTVCSILHMGALNTWILGFAPVKKKSASQSHVLNCFYTAFVHVHVHVDIYCFQKYFVCVFSAQKPAVFQDPGINPAGTLTRQTLRSKRADVRRVLLSALFSLEIKYSRVKRRATVCKPLCIKFLRAFFTTACTLPRNGTYGSTLHRVP